MTHTLPGTYILRELQDVIVPPPISWQPQTAGWLLLTLLLGLLVLRGLYYKMQRWWQQRYRREALVALRAINWSDKTAPLTLFQLIKQVLTHLAPEHGKLFGIELLHTLDHTMPDRQPRFESELGERWLVSLVCDQLALSVSDQVCLVSLCSDWLQHHTPRLGTLKVSEADHA